MSHELMAAGEALAAALAEETAALGEPGFPRAGACVAAKVAALEAFSSLIASAPPMRRDVRATLLLARLRHLAEKNQAALEGAMRVQTSVLDALREAMERADAAGEPASVSFQV